MSERGGVYRKALRHADFRWLTLSEAQSAAGDFLYNVALFVVVFERTHSAAWVSATAVLIRVPRVILPPLAGVLADRVERRNLMMLLDVARAVVMGVIAVSVFVDAPVGLVVALAVVVASLATPYGPALVGLLPSLIPEEDLAAANAVSGGLESLALVLGPAIGGLLLVIGSPTTAFVINAVTFATSALCILKVSRGSRPTSGETDERTDGVLDGARAILSDAKVVVLAGGLVATCFAIGASGVLFVLISDERLGTGAHGYGYLLAAVGLGGVLASVLSDRLARANRLASFVVVALVVVGGSFAALTLVHAPAIAYVLAAVFGGGYQLLEVLSRTLTQRCLAPTVLGKASGTLDAVTFAAVLVGAALVAPINDAFGLTAAILVATAPAFIAAVATGLAGRRLDRQSVEDMKTIAPRVALLEGVDVMQGATRPPLERLASVARDMHVPAGVAVVTEGEPADNFYVIVNGEAEVVSTRRAGTGEQLRILGPGDSFGEIGLLEHRPRTASVRTTTDALLLEMPGDAFVEVVTAAPALADSFGAMVTTRLARSREVERR
jgi:MFS family permease